MLKSNNLNSISALVKEEIQARRWSHAQLASEMRMHGRYCEVYKLLDGKLELNEALANGLAKAFGVRAEWWLELNDLLKAANVEQDAETA